MSVSDFGITRSMSQSSRESVIKVADTDMGSFISASADILKDSQDGDSDEEEGNDKAFAQKYQQLHLLARKKFSVRKLMQVSTASY